MRQLARYSIRCALAMTLVLGACGGDDDDDDVTPDAAVSGGTLHDQDITADETWSAAGNPHVVDGCITVGGTSTTLVTLTIEAGVEVRFTAGSCLIVGETDMRGSLVAIGTADDTVLFTSDQDVAPTPGYWDAILFGQEAAPVTLEYVEIAYGGRVGSGAHSGPNWVDAMVIAWGNSDALPELTFDHVLVHDSSTDGMVFESGARFAGDSVALSVPGCEGYPVHIEASSAHALPTDGASAYTGNGDDVIYLLDGNGWELASGSPTWNDPGVPYVISNEVDCAGADWTIASGVTIAGASGAEIMVTDGTMTADGVTFTSWPNSVNWGGIYFAPPGTGTISSSTVERGGANFGGNSNGYNIYVESGAVTLPVITTTTIKDSLHDGIATWDVPIATYQSNTFENNTDWDIYDYFNSLGWNHTP